MFEEIDRISSGTLNAGHPCCFCLFQIPAAAEFGHFLDSRFRLRQQLPSLKESVPKLYQSSRYYQVFELRL